MKVISCLVILVLMAAAVVATGQTTKPRLMAQHLDMLFAQAGELAKTGQIDEAKHLCRQILKLEPGRLDVEEFLKSLDGLESRVRRRDTAAELKRKLDVVVFSEINFTNATVPDVLTYLQKQSGLLSPDKTEVNFVWLVPPDTKMPTITLSLRRVSLSDLIGYVMEVAQLRYRVEEHAVVICKPEPAKNK